MSFNKYAFSTIGIYLLVFFAPVLFINQNYQIDATIYGYLIGALIMIFLYLKQQPKLAYEQTNNSYLKIVLWGISGIFLAMFAQAFAINIESFFNDSLVSQNTQAIVALTRAKPLFILATAIGGPIMEEFVFRRSLIGLISERSNLALGIIVSSLLFAFMHQDGHIFLYFSLALVLSFLYLKTQSIWTPIITHCGMNALVMIVQLTLNQ